MIHVELKALAGPRLVVEESGRYRIGRDPSSDLVLDGPGVEDEHCAIEVSPLGEVRIIDLGGGTLVGVEAIDARLLASGDRIGVGPHVVVVEMAGAAATWTPEPVRRVSLVPVRCGRCGVRSTAEPKRARSEQVAFFCAACRAVLVDEPPTPEGYTLVRRLGAGAMGAVWLADHVAGARALKYMLPQAALSKNSRKRFLREGAAMQALDHANVLRTFGLTEPAPGLFCLEMEYVDGRDLEAVRTEAGGIVPAEVAVPLVCAALDGLEHAHAAGLVHRDIKPGNILVGWDGSVKLADFGLAKPLDDTGASAVTRTGEIGGTPAFMAPEQVGNFRDVLPTVDVYAMGATLYLLLTGRTPHEQPGRQTPSQYLMALLEEPFTPLAQRNPHLPGSVVSAVERALVPAEKRYATAAEMAAALRAAL